MNPIRLKYERLDQYKVKVFAVYQNSNHFEFMGTLGIDDIPDDKVPSFNQLIIVAT